MTAVLLLVCFVVQGPGDGSPESTGQEQPLPATA